MLLNRRRAELKPSMRATLISTGGLPASDASSITHRDYLNGRNTIIDFRYNTRARASTAPSRRSSTALAPVKPKSASSEGGSVMGGASESTQQLLDNEQTWQEELEEERKARLMAALDAVRKGPLSNVSRWIPIAA